MPFDNDLPTICRDCAKLMRPNIHGKCDICLNLAACGGTFLTGLTRPPWHDFPTIYLRSHKISWMEPCTPALQSQVWARD